MNTLPTFDRLVPGAGRPSLAWWAGSAAALLAAAWFDTYLALPGLSGLPWLGAGVGLAIVLRVRWQGLPLLVGVWALAGVLAGLSPWAVAVQAVGPAGATWAVGEVLRRLGGRADLERARDALVLGAVALLVGGPLMAGVQTAMPAVARTAAEASLLDLLAWPWHALGLLTGSLPAIAVARASRRRTRGAWHLAGGVTLALSAVAAAWLWFGGLSLSIVASAAVAWWPHVLLLGLLLAGTLTLPLLALLGVAAVAAAGTATGTGPFASLSPAGAIAALCGYLGSLMVMLLTARSIGQELRLRERRAVTALGAARLAVAEWHRHRAEEVHLSADWLALTRHRDPVTWTPRAWLDDVHIDDRGRLQEALSEVTLGERDQWQQELRVQSDDGWHWVEVNVVAAERDLAGQPLRLVATMADVSERHEAQERQRLSASLFEHLHEGLLIADADLRVLDANAAYTQILDVTLAELIGRVPSLLQPNPSDPLARQQRAAMWTGLRQHGRWRGELIERRRDGQISTLQATISQVHGPEGDLRYHVLAISDITEQRVARERLERQAHFDELTRLPNRARLSQLLGDAMRAADRDGYLLAVCYLDLDRFKPVNDRHGHEGGDRLLVELAGRLRGALRSRDLWADAAARLGGDEFVLLLRAGSMEEARLAVERVLRVVSQPYVIDPMQEPVQITASLGATVYPIDRSDADTLLRHADHAMYGAKQSGRNGYLFFDPELRRRTEERVMAIGRVQEALDRAEFVLFYQPIVDMRSQRVFGLEALLRWDHPEKGLIAPMQFLPLITNTGLSARVGDWVLSQALEHLAQWRRAGLDLQVNVNISARHLQEPDFVQRLAELLARHPDPLAEHLKLEIVESEAHADLAASSQLLARCRALGVRSALDDFGTGHSTLTHLQRLPVDVLKIDRSFVNHMLDDAQDKALVEGVIGLARTFGCSVVAEGVETPAQARMLLDLGCDSAQGTGIAAPMPAAQVADWVRSYSGLFALAPAGSPRLATGTGPEAPVDSGG
ncbi:EAL domain-containing protein [Rubrivivax albus]|uniref:EAL domain-containing protein n=1 Tax=Rubrivivax albus TaxID=2499835 RepID=A0A3S2USP9_9BURK|nr:EAL domain-containing protein [Rubrivivax albus]